VKYTSAIAATGSGSIGGATASHNRGGQYFRRRAIPVNPATAQQEAIRALFATCQAAWSNTLTAAQRDAWNNYALNTPVIDTLGNSVNAGGKGMYTRGNVPRLQGSLARIDAGPTTFGTPAMTNPAVTTLVASTGVLTFTYTNTDPWAITTGGALLVFISRPQPLAVSGFKGPFRFAGKVLGNTGTPPTSPGTVTSPFTYVATQRGFVRFVSVDSLGRLSGQAIFPATAS
jgi:hypothetical protein